MSAYPVMVESATLRAIATVNGRAKCPVFLYLRSDQDTPLAVESLDLAASSDREILLSRIADDFRTEASLLLVQLAAVAAAAASQPKRKDNTDADPYSAVEGWLTPVNGAHLLNALVTTLRRYVAMPAEAAHAVALWIVHTYAPDVADFTPYMLAMSPVRECGKTTLIDVCEPLVFRPRRSDGMSAAALYRTIDSVRPTIFLDELDARLAGDGGENLRGVLNSGFSPRGRTTICVGDQHEAKDFRTYCPKMLAGIGRPWDTVLSRSIPIRLARATPRERATLAKVQGATIGDELTPLRAQCARWINDVRDDLAARRLPTVPAMLSARQADIWRPLFAIADVAGGRWPSRARAASEALHGVVDDEGDFGLVMLADLRTLFAEREADKLRSADVVAYLVAREDRPWPEMPGGRALSATGLAKLLRRFNVRPVNVRDSEGVAKGYKLAELTPVFARYLPNESDARPTPDSPATAATRALSGANGDGVAGVAATSGEAGPPLSLDDAEYERDERAGMANS
jgi:hypothetical protein